MTNKEIRNKKDIGTWKENIISQFEKYISQCLKKDRNICMQSFTQNIYSITINWQVITNQY